MDRRSNGRWTAGNHSPTGSAHGGLTYDSSLAPRPRPRCSALGLAEARAPSPGDALDVLGAARAVVGIDTGLTHLAVQQGTPTVTIFRAPAIFFRPWSHPRAVVGDRCDDACIAAETEYAYNDQVDLRGLQWQPRTCPVGGRCLDSVQPSDVLGALENVL